MRTPAQQHGSTTVTTRGHQLRRVAVAAAIAAGALLASQATATATAATSSQSVSSLGSADAPSGPINLYNQWTKKCADLPGYGAVPANTLVTQFTCNFSDSDNQRWKMVPTRTVGSLSLFQFVNTKSTLCLDLPGYGAAPSSSAVSVFGCNSEPSRDNQEWWLNDVGATGDYQIVNFQNGACLDVNGWAGDNSDLADNTQLTVFPCFNASWGNNGWDDHLWNLRSS
ncbi:RICIN domain-containing protein [Streptomyces sp. NPDC008092]|uniref:RICIN domain-containing protein n=1 Tax=Streptomyces sp. NPDC008092 TaxID=3364808 RepID=UPI0036E9DB5F